ncbi:MAG: TPM domain-containing protein [Telluria sp.]
MSSFSERMSRAVRHWRSSAADGRRAFPQETLAALAGAIAAGEQTHRGELRLIVEASIPFDAIWQDITMRQRALALFAEHGVWDTEDNCGVLIYVNLAERKVEIVADRNINRKIDSATWQAVCRTMTEGFARGNFHDSSIAAVEQVNALLRRHFPANGNRANELPDQPILM